ncbi:DExH-box ATP-dependent RNA helicase DExH8-like [Neltuma alba]|uniref:DExH-box ATP-dependent RNA helicase DExH8-like n=1 Tax=Neltuma alba TaxID=207710 RepID=UPI0010A2C819|nr:DExH-box ATP-dependent RNA helicase DExH8-like [Prosopis alba]
MASSPSSPTSSCGSSYSSPFSSLPIMSLRTKIVEKIQENRVTLIVGETGCGKSSQVPQFLLEENMAPILCTQPRRFAVVTVAKMVAKARNCVLGEEVGYHIGHSRNLSERSKIVFKTAGVLLEELREKGLTALKYKAIILDEVHERSVESDLVLVCVKQFLLKNKDLSVVLMSATADISRYKEYFRDLGRGDRVEVLAIPTSNQRTVFQCGVTYLEQVANSLGVSSELMQSIRPGPDPSTASANIGSELHKLIHDLVLHIHENEPDIEKSILVFLPTYYSLEQQYRLMKPLKSTFKVHILHSSIDTEQALMAMKISRSHRKVILATNIAESSVTIPKVAFVIDSCRSLQVYWNKCLKKEATELVWVSKSQADQRKGRTGRTCDGKVYRLVTGPFFNGLEDHEHPAILKLSLRLQVLLICCAESKAINDPKVLLRKALDSPDPQVVEDALDLLVRMHALRKTPRGRYEPTFYGRLIASFPLSFDASVLVLKFGEIGMLREGILLGIMMDMQPLPILHPFGEEALFAKYIECFYGEKTILNGRKEREFLGNFCAFQFWQHVFKDAYNVNHLMRVPKNDEVNPATLLNDLMPELEQEWCSSHYLLRSSLQQVSEIYEDILSSVHRFRPEFLSTSNALPSSTDPYQFKHTCLLEYQPDVHADVVAANEEGLSPSNESQKCTAAPYVASNHFYINDVAQKFATIIKEIRAQYAEDASGHQLENVDIDHYSVNGQAPLCVFFINGSCSRGSSCFFSHSLQAKRPQCKFFFSLQGCRNGEACKFSHDAGDSALSFRPYYCLPENNGVNAASLLDLFRASSNGSILILDDTDLHFTFHLASFYDPSKIISSSCLSEMTICEPSLSGVRILWGLCHPYETIIAKEGQNPIPWKEIGCVLWFPCFDGLGEDLDGQKHLLQNFFEYLAVRILADELHDVQVIITMNNLRFSRLQVEKLGRGCFFFLTESFAFDEGSFGAVHDTVANRKPIVTSRPVSYVFVLHRPRDPRFGVCIATLREHLKEIQKN